MKIVKIIVIAVLTIGLFTSSITTAQAPKPIEKSFNEKMMEGSIETRRALVSEKIKELATRYRINTDRMYATIAKCENTGLDPALQSFHRYSYTDIKRGIVKGEREKSFGLAMIHLPAHPDITQEQATNAEYSLEWMAQEFEAGRQSQWTCYTTLFGK